MPMRSIVLLVLFLFAACSGRGVPLPDTTETAALPPAAAAKPEIGDVRLALDFDPKTNQLMGTGNVFKASILNQLRKLRIALRLNGLRGGETLILSLIDPSGKESEPIVRQYAKEERGDVEELAYFESGRWRPGSHAIRVNLNEESFATISFAVLP